MLKNKVFGSSRVDSRRSFRKVDEKLFAVLLPVFLLLLFSTAALAVEEDGGGVELYGFADFFYAMNQDKAEADNFDFGQIEFDIGMDITETVFFEGAIAFNPEAEVFESGAFIIDFHIFGSEGGHVRPLGGVDHAGFLVGQFDVPFGIDYQVYPSIDRRMVTGPLVVHATHEDWNDYGVQLYAEHPMFNLIAYATNGFGYEAGYDATGVFLGYNGSTYDPEDETLLLAEMAPKMAVGGRLGVTPVEIAEVGVSYAGFINEDDEIDMSLLGVDFQVNYENIFVKGEYISHTLGSTGDNETTNTGFYVQGLYDFGKFYAFTRYGSYSPDIEGVDPVTRISPGGGWVIYENCQIRAEYQMNTVEDVEDDDVLFIQLVVGF